MKNNQSNKIKRRADTIEELCDEFVIKRIEDLEEDNNYLRKENEELFERSKHHYFALREWEMPCACILISPTEARRKK